MRLKLLKDRGITKADIKPGLWFKHSFQFMTGPNIGHIVIDCWHLIRPWHYGGGKYSFYAECYRSINNEPFCQESTKQYIFDGLLTPKSYWYDGSLECRKMTNEEIVELMLTA